MSVNKFRCWWYPPPDESETLAAWEFIGYPSEVEGNTNE